MDDQANPIGFAFHFVQNKNMNSHTIRADISQIHLNDRHSNQEDQSDVHDVDVRILMFEF